TVPVELSKEELANSPAPYIIVDKNGNVIAHEGRNRAVAMEKVGIEGLGVIVIHEGLESDLLKSQKFGENQRDFQLDTTPGAVNEVTLTQDAKTDIDFTESSTGFHPDGPTTDLTSGGRPATDTAHQLVQGSNIHWSQDTAVKTGGDRSQGYVGELPGSKYTFSLFKEKGGHYTARVIDTTKEAGHPDRVEHFPGEFTLESGQQFISDMFGDTGHWTGTGNKWNGYTITETTTKGLWNIKKGEKDLG
ncbi:unnamed protein product, partial [marine sediment metagenome]